MRPFSPFGHPPDVKQRLPSRWSCIVGDVDHGFERFSFLIWGFIVSMLWVYPVLWDRAFWTNDACSYIQGGQLHSCSGAFGMLSPNGWVFLELWGIALLVAFVIVMLVLGFGRRKG